MMWMTIGIYLGIGLIVTLLVVAMAFGSLPRCEMGEPVAGDIRVFVKSGGPATTLFFIVFVTLWPMVVLAFRVRRH